MKKTELDKHSVIEGFNRAAVSYDQAACLQREVADRLLERLTLIKYQPKTILDLGAGTGECSLQLAKIYPDAHIISLDIAELMLRYAREKLSGKSAEDGLLKKIKSGFERIGKKNQRSFLCADAERLPLKDNSVDLIFSSLTIQWCENLASLFKEFQRILTSDGFVLFSTFGIDTLKELKQSWSQVDVHGHVNRFSDLHEIGDQMLASGFRDPVVDTEFLVVEYQKVIELLRDLKAIGAQNHLNQRPKGLTTGKKLNQVLKAYENYRLDNGKFPATYEVIYGHAWGRALNLNPSPISVVNKTEAGNQEVVVDFEPRKMR